jgi:hypothetical protein
MPELSGFRNGPYRMAVVPFDLHRSMTVLPDALDFGHAQATLAVVALFVARVPLLWRVVVVWIGLCGFGGSCRRNGH